MKPILKYSLWTSRKFCDFKQSLMACPMANWITWTVQNQCMSWLVIHWSGTFGNV